MPLYACVPCGVAFQVSSGGICYGCGSPMVKVYTGAEVREIVTKVTTPSGAELERMHQDYLKNQRVTDGNNSVDSKERL